MKTNSLKRTGVLLLLIVSFLQCSKKSNPTEKEEAPKTQIGLLTWKPWKITARGYDFNNNNVLDSSENVVKGCEFNDIFRFYTDGSATHRDSCNSSTYPFSWKFFNNETGFKYNLTYYSIWKLDADSFILYHDTVAHFYRFAH